MIEIINGDLLQSDLPLIAHQTNCLGVMGAGIARQIKNKWSNVYSEYWRWCNRADKRDLLGTCQVCATNDNPIKYVANVFGEYSFTESVAPYENRHTNYDALRSAFIALINYCKESGITDIGIPYKIGCGLAGGDWDGVVYPMIQELFTDINVHIYKL